MPGQTSPQSNQSIQSWGMLNIPVKETTLSGWLVPTNPGRGSNDSGTAFQ